MFCTQDNCAPVHTSFRSKSVSSDLGSDLDATVQSIIDKMETGLEVSLRF